jgi:hypothetical protein
MSPNPLGLTQGCQVSWKDNGLQKVIDEYSYIQQLTTAIWWPRGVRV